MDPDYIGIHRYFLYNKKNDRAAAKVRPTRKICANTIFNSTLYRFCYTYSITVYGRLNKFFYKGEYMCIIILISINQFGHKFTNALERDMEDV